MRNRGRQCGGRGCQRRMGQFLDPALLLLLAQSSTHGYILLGRLAEFGLDFLSPAAVYRALREMEEVGWITSTWDDVATQGPPRRIYALTPAGRAVLGCCVAQLQRTQQTLEYFLALYDEVAAADRAEAARFQAESEETLMRIAIPAEGADLDAPVSPVFGRCRTFIFADPETLAFEALPNPALQSSSGAGVQAMQWVLQRTVRAVVAPQLGPNAFRVLQAAGVPAYVQAGATVREVIAAFNAGTLAPLEAPTAEGRANH